MIFINLKLDGTPIFIKNHLCLEYPLQFLFYSTICSRTIYVNCHLYKYNL